MHKTSMVPPACPTRFGLGYRKEVPQAHGRGKGSGVATTAARDAEALYSARGADEYEELWNDRRLAYEYLPTNDEHWQAALNAQRELARAGRHRAVGVHDLLTAVLAAAHNLTVVHYDPDFETAATVLAFEHRWVLPRGPL